MSLTTLDDYDIDFSQKLSESFDFDFQYINPAMSFNNLSAVLQNDDDKPTETDAIVPDEAPVQSALPIPEKKKKKNKNRAGLGMGKGNYGTRTVKQTVRHKKPGLKDNTISKGSVRRLARRAGVKRISSKIYEEINNDLRTYLDKIVRDAVSYCEHAKRKTVTATDILYSLKRQNVRLYGFN